MKIRKCYYAFLACLFIGCSQAPTEIATSDQNSNPGNVVEEPNLLLKQSTDSIVKKQPKASSAYRFSPSVSPTNSELEVEQIAPGKINVPFNSSYPAPLETTFAPTGIINPEPEIPFNDLQDLYRKLEKTAQVFTFSGQKDTVFTGLEGTIIGISANSFISEQTGKPVTEPIRLEVKEYYSMSDILLANLSTTSNDKLLETGGMIYLEAFSGTEKLKLKQGNTIKLNFPTTNFKPGMQLFNGELEHGQIDWILAKPEAKIRPASVGNLKYNKLKFSHSDPRFPAGDAALMRYYKKFPFPAVRPKRKKKRYGVYKFLVLADGTITDITVSTKTDPLLDKAAIYMIANMPKWKPAKLNGNPVTGVYEMHIDYNKIRIPVSEKQIAAANSIADKAKDIALRVTSKNTQIINDEERELAYLKETSDYNKVSTNSILTYALSATNLGWINCDRFPDNNKPRTEYTFKTGETQELNMKLVFHKYRSVISGRAQTNSILFYSVPQDEPVTLVAIKKKDDKLFLATKELITSGKELPELTFQEVSFETLKKEIFKLNSLDN